MLWRAAFGEVFNGVAANFNPTMSRLLEDRSNGSRVFWVRYRPNSNANQRG
jgi:hypothetical protein